MAVFNHDFTLTADAPESTRRPAAGADRFGLQIVPDDACEAATVALQGSIDGAAWADLAEATTRTPLVGCGGTAKSPVVRYVRVVARTLSGDGASVRAHVVAK
ncbi:hypothetical protein QTQ03_16660 [Micromonospora sp. WMMA1363]|uniref:hypothetical protein n=1 Tax=Micromonospora sp. WMMA1363 TaxID=3053985 RepID=UPI00259CE48A|nr:hypothetical protein [Micromonospora sp. WMMA1363]MDM4721151.1 hypothetical protein [Micromonospora sp. WMMA1363]